jgi:hypothetical protein
MHQVSDWIRSIEGLPPECVQHYDRLFKNEEIFSMQQVRKLQEHHLHWMGVKVGSLILMIEAISALPGMLENKIALTP